MSEKICIKVPRCFCSDSVFLLHSPEQKLHRTEMFGGMCSFCSGECNSRTSCVVKKLSFEFSAFLQSKCELCVEDVLRSRSSCVLLLFISGCRVA